MEWNMEKKTQNLILYFSSSMSKNMEIYTKTDL